MKKKIVSCLLVTSMVAGMFVGYGDSKVEASNQDQETVSQEEQKETTEEGEQTEGETEQKETELSMFIDFTWFLYDEWGTESISQEITKRTGMSFDITRSTGSDNLPLLVAGGDLPDIVYAANDERCAALCDEDVCWTYDELLEMYPDIELNITDEERMYNTALSPDGKLYCVRNAMLSGEYDGEKLAGGGDYYLVYRKDILDELGLEEPTNMDELEDILMKVKEAYPDMLPLCWRDGYEQFFANQMGHAAWWNIGYKDSKESGEMALWLETEGMKDVYATINRFARNGLINAETTTYDMNQTYEFMESGKGFACITAGDGSIVFQNAADVAGETDVDWKLMTEPFTTYEDYFGLGAWAGFFITKNCKDPEAALRFLAYMRTDEGRRLASWGIEGVDWEFDADGNFTRTEEYIKFLADGGLKSEDKGIGCWIFGDQGEESLEIDKAGAEKMGDDQKENFYARLNYGAVQKVYPELTFVEPKVGTDLSNKYAALIDAMGSLEAKVMFAGSEDEFEKAWTDMIDQANAYGMQEINEYATQVVADYRANN